MDEIEFLEYIRCYDPSTFPHPAWKKWDTILKHIDEIISVYRLMVEEGLSLSEASKQVNPRNYRRLEATVKALRLVEKIGRIRKKYVPAGVLCECRVYLSYLQSSKLSWRRKAEVQFLVPAPLGSRCNELISAIGTAHDIMKDLEMDIPWDREVFDGCDRVDCGRLGTDCWCNYKERIPLFNTKGRLDIDYHVELYRLRGDTWVHYATYEGSITKAPEVVKD